VRGLRGLIGAGAIGLAIAVVVASRAEAQDLVVKNARVIVAASNATDARVVGVISNPGMYSTYLVSATSDAAERVELRDARKKDARVPEVEIPAYGALTLEPRGLYLTLINLKKPLGPGARVEVVLSNEAQVKTRLTAVVGP
jgi:copper(I)-binding protein